MLSSRLSRRVTLKVFFGAVLTLTAVPAGAKTAAVGIEIASADTQISTRDGRTITVRITWPTAGRGRLPLLVFSHGANGTLDGLEPVQRGLTHQRIVAAPQHPDSEANPDLARVDRKVLLAQRVADMVAVLDARLTIERVTGRKIDTTRIDAGGHSYGALVAQALGGAMVEGKSWRDARIKRVVAFSPPGPFLPLVGPDGWKTMAVSQLVTTGTLDVQPMITPTWEGHMTSFTTSPVHGSALWVGRGVDHYWGNHIQRLTRVAPDQTPAFMTAMALAESFLARKPMDAAPGAVTERFLTK